MTPERLKEIESNAGTGYTNGLSWRDPLGTATSDVWELLAHIDSVNEELRNARAEAWDEGARAAEEQWTRVGYPANPYRD